MDKTDTKHVRFYYLRDEWDNAPFGCVCTIRGDDNKFYRGISLCNFMHGDRFSKTIGRNISYSRAMKAFTEGSKAKNAMYGLSEYLADKLEYIWDKYELGLDGDENAITVNSIEADVQLTPAEKSMWKDIIDPKFEK